MTDLRISKIENKKIWEDFLLSQEHTPFLQSWNSGLHYQKCGYQIFRFGLWENQILKAIFLVIKLDAKRGAHLYIPYGPIITDWTNKHYFETISCFLQKLAHREKTHFVKISPCEKYSQNIKDLFVSNGFRKSQIHVLSESSWILDLTSSEDDLFAGMRKTNRNLIRRAIKEGVEIQKSTTVSDIDYFYELYKETGKRHGFVLYPYDFIKKQVEVYLKDDQCLIYLAKYQGQVISAAVIMYYGREGAYHHGASSLKHSKIPASYLLQWEAIKEAKRRGHEFYNFWGIYTGDRPNHPFSGITHFKKGFGGKLREMMPCYDLPITPLYWFNYLVEKIRRIKRGF